MKEPPVGFDRSFEKNTYVFFEKHVRLFPKTCRCFFRMRLKTRPLRWQTAGKSKKIRQVIATPA